MKKAKVKNSFLEELRKVPIVQVACEKVGLSRTSVYRWRESDEKFKAEMDKASAEGEALVNDMSESQLLSLIKERNFPAISFWLRHRNTRFKDKMEVTAKIQNNGELTPEQEAIVREALKLAQITEPTEINSDNDNQHDNEKCDPNGSSGNNDPRPES
ncbi:MAG: phBC6A51 family helix-turn-helix protein [Candidatus Paceibacterota bacterium]|jgi:predicted DNA-binding transcriptional regulator AlpA